jgi:hypothetical protein
MNNNLYIDRRYLIEDSRKYRNEGIEVVSWILFLLTFPVVSAAIYNLLKIFINTVVPQSLKVWDEKNGNYIDNVLKLGDVLIEKVDKLAETYIKIIIKVMKYIPKIKNKSDDELKHVAVTIYYTITVGLILKVVKILMAKSGSGGDSIAMGQVRDIITHGLKLGSQGLSFDDIEKEADVMFSNKSFAPMVNQLTSIIFGKLGIFEQKHRI